MKILMTFQNLTWESLNRFGMIKYYHFKILIFSSFLSYFLKFKHVLFIHFEEEVIKLNDLNNSGKSIFNRYRIRFGLSHSSSKYIRFLSNPSPTFFYLYLIKLLFYFFEFINLFYWGFSFLRILILFLEQ